LSFHHSKELHFGRAGVYLKLKPVLPSRKANKSFSLIASIEEKSGRSNWLKQLRKKREESTLEAKSKTQQNRKQNARVRSRKTIKAFHFLDRERGHS
jgi:hypothetical protein